VTPPSSFEVAIGQFVEAARAYCAWLEAEPQESQAEVMAAIRLLSRLVAAMAELPDVDIDYLPTPPEAEVVDDESMKRVAERLRAFPMQFYWEVFHSLALEAEAPCLGDICDDLLDTYRDVKEGLLTFDEGHEPLAVWHWRMTFGFHWGRHAFSALKALHEFDPDEHATLARPK
jgi:hypothetical protein